jgi:uncharacterized protein DUF4129
MGPPRGVFMTRYSPLIVRGSLLLMESLWVYALVAWLIAITVEGDRPTLLGVAVVVFASFAISRALQNSELSLGILRFWGAFLSIIVFYAIVRYDFYGDLRLWDFTFLDDLFNDTDATLEAAKTAVIGVPLLWAFWMRGVLRGQQSITFDDVLHSFATGLVIVAVVSLFAGIDEDLPRAVDFVAIPYIAVGLLALGLAHTSRTSDQFERGFANEWLLVAGGGLAAMAVVALLFVIIDYDTARDGLEAAGRGIGYVVAGIFYVVLWPILKIVELGFEGLRWLMSLWGGQQQEPIQDEFGEIPDPREREGETDSIPGWVEMIIRVVVAGGLVAVVLLGTAMLFSRFRKATGAEGVRESTYSEGRLGQDLGDMLNSFFGRFLGRSRQAQGQTEPVRRLYFEMLDAAADRGVERRPMETPLELAPRLTRTFNAPAPAEITRVFDDVRYGAIPPSEEEVRRLRDEWERLEK